MDFVPTPESNRGDLAETQELIKRNKQLEKENAEFKSQLESLERWVSHFIDKGQQEPAGKEVLYRELIGKALGEIQKAKKEGRSLAKDLMVAATLTDALMSEAHKSDRENQDLRKQLLMENKMGIEGLHGAAGFGIRLRETLERLAKVPTERREGMPNRACLIMADANNFKEINDRFGHPAGDRVLQSVVELLMKKFRSGTFDVIGRLGGDEFGVIVNGLDISEIENRLSDTYIPLTDPQGKKVLTFSADDPAAVSLSCGVLDLVGISNAEEALTKADMAMFNAKAKKPKSPGTKKSHEFRGAVTIFAEGMEIPKDLPGRKL